MADNTFAFIQNQYPWINASSVELFYDSKRSSTLEMMREQYQGTGLIIREKDKTSVRDRIIAARAEMSNIAPYMNRVITLLRLSAKFMTYIALKKGVNASIQGQFEHKDGTIESFGYSYADFAHLHEYLLGKKLKSLPRTFAYSKKRLPDSNKKSISPGSYPVAISTDLGKALEGLIRELRQKYDNNSDYVTAAISLVADTNQDGTKIRSIVTRDALLVFITMVAGYNNFGGNIVQFPISGPFHQLLQHVSPFESDLKDTTDSEKEIGKYLEGNSFIISACKSKKSGTYSNGIKDKRVRVVNSTNQSLLQSLKERQVKKTSAVIYREDGSSMVIASSMLLAVISAHTFGKSDYQIAGSNDILAMFPGVNDVNTAVEDFKLARTNDDNRNPYVWLGNYVATMRKLYKDTFQVQVTQRTDRKSLEAKKKKSNSTNVGSI